MILIVNGQLLSYTALNWLHSVKGLFSVRYELSLYVIYKGICRV